MRPFVFLLERLGFRSHLRASSEYDVILHIGAPKTGSSALQLFLFNNRDLLMKYGFFYPVHGFDKNGISGGHSDLGLALISNDTAAARNHFIRYKAEADNHGLSLLLSAESIFNYPEVMAKLLTGFRVKIIAYYREPLSLILSGYNQAIKRHYAQVSLERYCELVASSKSDQMPSKVLARWQRCFSGSDLAVMPYDENRFGSNWLEKLFLSVLGVEARCYGHFKFINRRINGGYVASALELKRLLNGVLDREQVVLNNRIDWCLQSYSDSNYEPMPSISELISRETYLKLVNSFGVSDAYKNNNGSEDSKNLLSDGGVEAGDLQYRLLGGAHRYSLRCVVNAAFKEDDEIVQYILHRIYNFLDKPGHSSSVVRLAGVFGLDVASYASTEGKYTV